VAKPGRCFVLHTAHGTIGGIGAGATEVVRFDRGTGQYRSHRFDSQGEAWVTSMLMTLTKIS
jgi:hypothetical protein